MEPKCDLKSLCDHHCALHKRWGHVVSVLVPAWWAMATMTGPLLPAPCWV
jgi:hypothetical protein